MAKVFTAAAGLALTAMLSSAAFAQGEGRLAVRGTAPTPSMQTGANRAANLRAAPLPADSLSRPPMGGATSTYSVPYGPHLTRPAGSAIVPFGSSRYYYRR